MACASINIKKLSRDISLEAPLISIVIPNFNYANFLERRLDSILNQTISNREIIFLDDASIDDSVELVKKKYKNVITKLDVNSVNSGSPFVQWNRGVRQSSGKYVWIAEADDTCAPTFLEKAIAVLESNPSIGLVYCHTLPMDVNDQILDEKFFFSYVSDLDTTRWMNDFYNSGIEEVRNYLSRKNTITNVSGVVFRREAYIKAGYAPENMRMCGDWMFYCHLLRHFDVAYLSEPLNFHRQHSAKQTMNSVLNLTYFREFLEVQEYLLKDFSLSSEQRALAFRRFLGEWDRLVYSNYGRISASGNLAIAKMTLTKYSLFTEKLVILWHAAQNTLKSVLYKWLKKS